MASNKNNEAREDKEKRSYELKERARKMEETRRRITEATVELHRTVGPARTTVSEIAKRAGVRRMTVYNHFPGELELIDACSSHWVTENPPPDPAPWAEIADPGARLAAALEALYPYYRKNADMLGNVLRDAAIVPALDQINHQKWWPYIDAVVDVLMGAEQAGTVPASARRAAVRLAVDFCTWQTLAASDLDDGAVATLVSNMVAGARSR
jgi:AcrR family transcriptional regulator